jgi:general stress protein 26
MRTKITVEIDDVKDAEAIHRALQDPAVRAFVIIMGTLSTLKSQREKERVLTYVKDHFEEMDARA